MTGVRVNKLRWQLGYEKEQNLATETDQEREEAAADPPMVSFCSSLH